MKGREETHQKNESNYNVIVVAGWRIVHAVHCILLPQPGKARQEGKRENKEFLI